MLFFFIYFISAFIIGKWIIGIIVLFSYLFYICTNIIMYIIWKRKIKKDFEFLTWSQKFRKTSKIIPFLSLFISFRFFKLFYSGLFGIQIFMAQFDDPGNTFKYIHRMTLVVFLLCYLPALIASILSFMTVYWGYQTMICAIEAVILFLLFALLLILECIFNRKSKFKDMYKPIDGTRIEDQYAGVKGLHFDELNNMVKINEKEALYDMYL